MLAIIGGGYWGKNLIKTFNELKVLKTICEIDENAIEGYNFQYPHVGIERDFQKVLNDEAITMICIALPANMHYEYAHKALLSGKHIFVEKPITLNVDEALKLKELSEQLNLICMVGHLLHYHNSVVKIKEILPTLGEIKYITSNRKSHGIYRTCENVLWSFAPHDISIALALCNATYDDCKDINCNGSGYISKGVQDIVNLNFKANNIYVNINVDWNSPYKEQKLSIACSHGILLFDDVNKTLQVYRNHINRTHKGPVASKNNVETLGIGGNQPLHNECEHFIQCCVTRNKPITNVDEGINVLRLLMHADLLMNPTVKSPMRCHSSSFSQHETAIVDNMDSIGDGTKIWHFTHVTNNAKIGIGCNIGQNCYIDGIIGNRCKVQNNVSIYKGVEAGNNVFFGPSCVLTNDINPRCEYSKGGNYMKTIIDDGVTIGANATIVCGKRIGRYALIGAGAVITKDVEPYSIMVGNPAKKIGTIDEKGNRKLN